MNYGLYLLKEKEKEKENKLFIKIIEYL